MCCETDLKPVPASAWMKHLVVERFLLTVHRLFCCVLPAADLKPALCKALNAILEPVRRHFVENKEAATLLKQVRSYKVTR